MSTTYIELLEGEDGLNIPSGVQIGIPYVLTGPDGTRAVFNDSTDPDYVGVLTSVSGLDMAEVRESSDNRVQADGGLHGDFFLGRRPVTLEGVVLNPLNPEDRNRKITRIKRAALALRQDATLQWTYATGVTQFISVRLQAPLRIEGAWQKSFFLSVVSADHRIYGVTRKLHMFTGAAEVEGEVNPVDVGTFAVNNDGSMHTPTLITIGGVISDLRLVNMTTGAVFGFSGTVGLGENLQLDSAYRTSMSDLSGSRYSETITKTSEWIELAPGRNEITVYATDTSPTTYVRVEWRDAWI